MAVLLYVRATFGLSTPATHLGPWRGAREGEIADIPNDSRQFLPRRGLQPENPKRTAHNCRSNLSNGDPAWALSPAGFDNERRDRAPPSCFRVHDAAANRVVAGSCVSRSRPQPTRQARHAYRLGQRTQPRQLPSPPSARQRPRPGIYSRERRPPNAAVVGPLAWQRLRAPFFGGSADPSSATYRSSAFLRKHPGSYSTPRSERTGPPCLAVGSVAVSRAEWCGDRMSAASWRCDHPLQAAGLGPIVCSDLQAQLRGRD